MKRSMGVESLMGKRGNLSAPGLAYAVKSGYFRLPTGEQD